jgi:hypothetical protein
MCMRRVVCVHRLHVYARVLLLHARMSVAV